MIADFRAAFFEAAPAEARFRAAALLAALDVERVPVPVLRVAFVVPRAVPRLRAAPVRLVDFVRVDFAPAALRVARFCAAAAAREALFAPLPRVPAFVRVFFAGVLLRFVVFMAASGDVRG